MCCASAIRTECSGNKMSVRVFGPESVEATGGWKDLQKQNIP